MKRLIIVTVICMFSVVACGTRKKPISQDDQIAILNAQAIMQQQRLAAMPYIAQMNAATQNFTMTVDKAIRHSGRDPAKVVLDLNTWEFRDVQQPTVIAPSVPPPPVVPSATPASLPNKH